MNAIKFVNSLFRQVTEKGAFPNENALFKLLYLRVIELYKKSEDSTIQNWSMVRNRLDAYPKFQDRFSKYVMKLFDINYIIILNYILIILHYFQLKEY